MIREFLFGSRCMRSLVLTVALTVAVSVALFPAVADAAGPAGGKHGSGSFWKRFTRPKGSREMKVLRQAIVYLQKARRARRALDKLRFLHKAVNHLGRALGKGRGTAAMWYWYGYALYHAKMYARSRRALVISRTLDPKFYMAADIAFKLGVIYTYELKFAKAFVEYKIGIQKTTKQDEKATLLSNAAECLMGMGKLQQAIQYYRRSLQVRLYNNYGALWGLSVALDRDEQVSNAMRTARAALLRDPRLRTLVGPGVFFVPKGEHHYYLAMAYEAKRNHGAALTHWMRYIKARPSSAWAVRAAAHIKKLRGRMGKAKAEVSVAGRAPLVQGLPVSAAWGRRLSAGGLPAVKLCYRNRAKKLPVPSGLLELVIRVDGRGRVRAVTGGQRGGDPGRDSVLMGCISKKLKGRPLRGLGGKRGSVKKVSLFYQLTLKW